MGRSNRQTADYFPHYVGEKSRTKFILEKNWGNDGYAFWFKLLELLCAADGQYYDCWDKMGWEYLLAVTGVTAETAEAILNTLASMGKVDKELWESCRVIWVQSLLENLRQLYSKRTAAPTKPSVDNFPGRRVESPAQEPAEATEAEGTPPDVPEPAPEEHDKPKAPRRKAGSLSAEQAERFDRFYAAYPKKVDRATAERAWAKINPEPDDAATDRIIEAAKKYDSRFRERQFTPNPASWLNAKGYMNDYTGGEQRGNADGYAGFTPSGGFGSFG